MFIAAASIGASWALIALVSLCGLTLAIPREASAQQPLAPKLVDSLRVDVVHADRNFEKARSVAANESVSEPEFNSAVPALKKSDKQPETVSPPPPAGLSTDKDASQNHQRVALVIANTNYPDDSVPLAHPANDARAMAGQLRQMGFAVNLKNNLTKQGMRLAIEDFKTKIAAESVALIFFSGYGIQSDRQTYMLPVDAQIWAEADVLQDGIDIEAVLAEMGKADIKLLIMDASRRNPFEPRFRDYSMGLAPVMVPDRTLAVYSAAPGKVIEDEPGENGVFMQEFLRQMQLQVQQPAEEVARRTRMAVARLSKGGQIPFYSSSLIENFYFSSETQAGKSDTQCK